MTTDELINALRNVPAGTIVRVVDMSQNMICHLSEDDDVFDGCYDEFKLAYFDGKDRGEGYMPFFALIIDNPVIEEEDSSFSLN